MTYEEAIAYIHHSPYRGEKNGLENTRMLLNALGNPHLRLPLVHVAGTNGKGSTCACITAMLRAAGYRVGLYTSPFLQRYNERMRLDGAPIRDEALASCMTRIAQAVETLLPLGICPTEFELGTALAFDYFALSGADIAVIEVGMGGRRDVTNVITPHVSVITAIGLDHTRILGDTLEKIAWEKAGIAKAGVPLVLQAAPESVAAVIAAQCEAVGAPLWDLGQATIAIETQTAKSNVFSMAFRTGAGGFEAHGLAVSLPGDYQVQNAATAYAAMMVLRAQGFSLPEEALRRGLAAARWPGRLEWIEGDVPVLLDGAHNPQGAQALAAFVQRFREGRRVVLVCGVMRDKAYGAMIDAWRTFADEAVTVAPDSHRALDGASLAQALAAFLPAVPAENVAQALTRAKHMAGPDGFVVVTGSLYLVGEARTVLGALDAQL